MAGKHYRDNFLFARAPIVETPGVSQYVAYAVSPAPVEITKGFYFPDTGEIAFHPMHKSGKRLHQEAVYEGRATEEFREAVLSDAYRSDENPEIKVSYCVMEEYGLYRAKDLDAVPKHSVQIEFIELASIITFRFVEHMANTENGQHRAKYELLFSNNVTIPLEILTADAPFFLEDLDYSDYTITVGGVVFDLGMQLQRLMRMFNRLTLDRDLFAKNQQAGS